MQEIFTISIVVEKIKNNTVVAEKKMIWLTRPSRHFSGPPDVFAIFALKKWLLADIIAPFDWDISSVG